MSAETIMISPKACLFDMDGTLIDSSPAVESAWTLMRDGDETEPGRYPFIDLPHILKSAHGYRTTDALRKWCLIEDEEVLAKEVVRFEVAILSAAKKAGPSGEGGVVALPGVKDLLAQLGAGAEESRGGLEKWAICTSSTHFYASQAIPLAGLPTPKIFITAESVKQGKPKPDPYLLGAERNGVPPEECVCFEDAPTGIRSGKAAGNIVIATCTSHTRESLEKEKPDFLVEDLTHVQAKWIDGVLYLAITQPGDRKTPMPTPLATPVGSRRGSMEDLQAFAKAAGVGMTPVGTPAADIKGAFRGMSAF